jgi:diguanylate cyclase (GGDEF)-like protein
MDKPSVVEFTPNGAALDGEVLTPDELSLIVQNAESGLASIKWRTLAKKESSREPSLQETMRVLRAAVKAGHIDPKHERILTKHIYEDHMVPGIGNKRAFADFIREKKPGVYGSVDLNNFKHINDKFGHPKGDQAIKNIGGALKRAAEKSGNIKLHRVGGDEFAVHAPDEGSMHQFIRHARSHMDSMPKIQGVHKPSFSIGVGHNYPTADKALLQAKKQKIDPATKKQLYHPQRTPHFGHSLLQGSEGPIKMS